MKMKNFLKGTKNDKSDAEIMTTNTDGSLVRSDGENYIF